MLQTQIQHHEVEGRRFGRFRGKINSTCIVYRIGSVVIDTGPPNQWKHVQRFLTEKDVAHVLLTHHHEDHSGNAGAIQTHFKTATLYSHPHSSELIQNRHFLPYQKWVWGIPKSFQSKPIPEEINQGDLVLKPLACPGHAKDMFVYLEPHRGWLFSGDLYIAKRPRYARLDENPVQEIQTLKAILSQDFNTLFCAHRGLVPDGKKALKAKLDFLETIYEESRQRFHQGHSLTEITHDLLGKESWLYWLSSGDFSKTHFIQSCLQDLLSLEDKSS